MNAMSKLGLYARTIARMKPSQIAGRLRKEKRVPLGDFKAIENELTLLIEDADLSRPYLRRFDVDALVDSNEMLLLNSRYIVDFGVWKVPEASHLWNFNLHYFEYAIALGAKFRETGETAYWSTFKMLVNSWISACEYADGDGWHPYTISLRLVNWLVCRNLFEPALKKDQEFNSRMQSSMYLQYRHLLANQETGLLANHYFENLKTLVIMSLSFGENDTYSKVLPDFLKQLDEQVLPDGVHFERSMMYHKLVLEGLMRVLLAIRQAKGTVPSAMLLKMQQMLDALVSIEKGMGKTPFFNDSADEVAKEAADLTRACGTKFGICPNSTKQAFPDSGFYKLYDGDAALVFFAGQPGPKYMLGHAHCDLLSFELSIGGKPVIVNSGTYAYQSELRPYFRSTAAHNTITVEGDEQMECWAEHRVARGVRGVEIIDFDKNRIRAGFTSCGGVRYERDLVLRGGVLSVDDKAMGKGGGLAPIAAFVHIAPGIDNSRVRPLGDASKRIAQCNYSPQFGVLEESNVVAINGSPTAAHELRFEVTR